MGATWRTIRNVWRRIFNGISQVDFSLAGTSALQIQGIYGKIRASAKTRKKEKV